jgi:hypothetical protein
MKILAPFLLLACGWLPLPGAPAGDPVPRAVVILWDSKAATPAETLAARMAEPALWQLGLLVSYHDLRLPLPDLAHDPNTLGVLTWWPANRLPDPPRFVSWLETLIRAGKRVVCLGEPGIDYDEAGQRTPPAIRARFWRLLGLADTGRWEQVTYDQRILASSSRVMGPGRPLPSVLPPFRTTVPAVSNLHSHLVVGPATRASSPAPAAHLVVTSPAGGYVAAGYTHAELAAGERQWHLDPVAFLEEAFGVAGIPKPDPAVVSGRPVTLITAAEAPVSSFARRHRGGSFPDAVAELAKAFPDLPFSLTSRGDGEPPRLANLLLSPLPANPASQAPLASFQPRSIAIDPDVLARSARTRQLMASLRDLQAARVLPSSLADYASDVERARRARIVRLGPNLWEISPGVSSVRFDHAAGLDVDLTRSVGVIGRTRRDDRLFLTLDPAAQPARLALQPSAAARHPYPLLIESRWRVTGVQASPGELRCRMRGFGPGEMVWQVPVAGEWLVEAPSLQASYRVRVGADLRLNTIVPLPAAGSLEIILRRAQ